MNDITIIPGAALTPLFQEWSQFISSQTKGAIWRTGSGVPADNLGLDGDFYLDSSANNVYERVSGHYNFICNLGANVTNGSNTFSGVQTLNLVDSGGQVFNVKAYGAKGDGITDDTAAINAAIAAAAAAAAGGPSTVLLPPANYLALGIALKSNVRLSGYGATIMKNGGSSSTYVVTLNGAATSTSTTLTADVAELSVTLSVTSAVGFSVGDYCLLYDSTNKTGSSLSRNQEIVRIKAIVNTTVTIYGSTIGSYATASTATLSKITPVANASIEGVSLVNAGSGGLVQSLYAHRCMLRDVEAVGSNDGPAYWIKQSQYVRLVGCKARDALNTVSPNGYGILFDQSSIGCIADGCHTKNIRENFVSNNARYCGFIGCQAISHVDSGYNSHGAGTEGCFFLNNTVVASASDGIAVGYTTDTAMDVDVLIDGNTIINCAGNSISVASNDNGLHRHKRITVTNNKIRVDLGASGFAGVYLSSVNQVTFSGNQISMQESNGYCFRMRYTWYSRISNNIISDSHLCYGIDWYNCLQSVIENNNTYNVGTPLRGSGGTNTNLIVRGNVVDKAKSSCVFNGDEILFNNTYNIAGAIDSGSVLALTYAASVTPKPNQAPYLTLVVTDGNAFTIANALPTAGSGSFTLTITNSSGGAMGTITWDTKYIFTNGSWTNPANGKSRNITFFYDGTNFVEQARSGQDF